VCREDCNACGKEGFSSRLVSGEAIVIIEEETGSSRGKEKTIKCGKRARTRKQSNVRFSSKIFPQILSLESGNTSDISVKLEEIVLISDYLDFVFAHSFHYRLAAECWGRSGFRDYES